MFVLFTSSPGSDLHQVHFALRGKDLLVRILGSHGVSEFIPTAKLRGDIPNTLLYQTHIVFYTDSRALEIYPTRSGWDPAASPSWRMYFNADPSSPEGQRPWLVGVHPPDPPDAVLCPGSYVVQSIHGILAALETSPTNLLVVSKAATPALAGDPNLLVKLPRYKLNFFVNIDGDLECKDLLGFSVSTVQSVGTLCGLESKLVLEAINGQGPRKVIIPHGTEMVLPGNVPSAPHLRVIITPSSDIGCHIRAFIYDVDNLIGRLVGDGTLTSWYLLAYLHILTSYWLSDPLTHRTGIQHGLQMLRSANSFSFMELTDEHTDILGRIIDITPTRQYYHGRLTSMETVTWHSVLPPLSQIALYTPLVEAILDHGSKQGLFRSGGPKASLRINEKGIVALRERAEFRNGRFAGSDLQDLEEKPAGTTLIYTCSSDDDAHVPSPFRCVLCTKPLPGRICFNK